MDQKGVQSRDRCREFVRHSSEENPRVQETVDEHLVRHLPIYFYQGNDSRVKIERGFKKCAILRQSSPSIRDSKEHYQADQRGLIRR